MDAESLVIDAFEQLGIDAQSFAADSDRSGHLAIDPARTNVIVEVKYRSLVSDDVAERLLTQGTSPGSVLLVVGERVTEAGRTALTSAGAGFFDMRGRLALRAHRLVIDAEVSPVAERAARTHALNGKAGLEVATAVLLDPRRRPAVRELARELNRSVSTVSDVLAALRRDDFLDAKNNLRGTQLFWQVEQRWTATRVQLASVPMPGDASVAKALRLGLDDLERPGWALTDSAAAAAYGAPLGFRSDQVLDFFVPDQSIVRRATTLLGTAVGGQAARATVRVAPVPAVVDQRVDLDTNPVEWPLARPLFVALDLASDAGRGREILDAWTPDERWTRVW